MVVLGWMGQLDRRHRGIMLSKCPRVSESNFWDSQLHDRVSAGPDRTILIN